MELLAAITEKFKCTACTRYVMPPIKLCKNGHCFCHSCFKKIHRCTLCKAPKSEVSCVLLEKLHASLVIPCAFMTRGCEFETFAGLMSKHQINCTFREKACPVRFNETCLWQGPRSEMIEHCMDCHPDPILCLSKLKLTSANFKLRREGVFYFVFYTYDKLFRFTWDLDKDTGLIRLALYCLGESENDMFDFEMNYLDEDSETEVIRLKGPCYAMGRDNQRFLKGKYFVMHHDHIKELCDQEGNLYYCVNIVKKN